MRDEMSIKIIQKGEKFTMPINGMGFCWINIVAPKNGILITFGPSGGFGVFVEEDRFREVMKQFESILNKDPKNRSSEPEEEVDAKVSSIDDDISIY